MDQEKELDLDQDLDQDSFLNQGPDQDIIQDSDLNLELILVTIFILDFSRP
jgi:hypothetical protein